MIRNLLFFILLLVSSKVTAQISGIVKDSKTEKPIEGVEVFINNSSWHSVTDQDGTFMLDGLTAGFFDLILYKKGFELFKSSIRVQEGKLYKLTLELHQTPKKTVSKAKRDDQWNNNYLWYSGGLLGSNEFSAFCQISNNPSIRFHNEQNKLLVTAEDPISINNQALGLNLKVFLQHFEASTSSSEIRAYIYFQLKSSSDYEQQTAWERNRLKAFWGSSRHFFQSLIDGASAIEGFSIFQKDNSTIISGKLVSPGNLPNYYKFNLPPDIKVKFQIKGNDLSHHDDEQISEISFQEGFEVSGNGIPFTPNQVTIKGAMETFGLAKSLPLNYIPTASIQNEKMDWKNFSMLREKVYLHTDRDYYYPRETIWFKAYFGYSLPILRDTLSGVLYVDLISPEKRRLDTRTYRVKEGVTWGEFKLDPDLPAGDYYLRAYTNWMRNYGDSALFIKQVPILSFSSNIEQSTHEYIPQSSALLHVKTDQETYAGRKKVTLQIYLNDEQGLPDIGNLSVSVTDGVNALLLNPKNITHPSALAVYDLGVNSKFFDEIKYFMERGLSFRGVVKDSKGLASPAKIDIIQGNMDNLISMETNERGEFLVTGLHFNDSILFAFKPVNAKGKSLPRVDLIASEIPETNFNVPPLPYSLRNDNAIQRIQNVYSPDKDAILLQEIEIKGTKLAADSPNEPVRIYGTPDYVIKGDNLRGTAVGTNFLVGLQGKVPGLQVIESLDAGGLPTIRVRVRGGTSSLAGNTEPLILVDGIPFPDAQSISALDPSMVDKVEVITRASPQFGSRGSNGVISIFTKQGAYATNSERNYLSFKVPGYNRPAEFFSPDYSRTLDEHKNPDFRTTIFWRPTVITDNQGNSTLSFYTADLATKYRIVVEGVTSKGTPVRSVTYINVE